MKAFNHDNVNEFVGMCINLLDVYVVTGHCHKGSLQVWNETENFEAKNELKTSALAKHNTRHMGVDRFRIWGSLGGYPRDLNF